MAASRGLMVRVVSPKRELFRGEAASLVVPAWDGRVGILPGHAPFIALLGYGGLAIDLPGGGSREFYVAGGVLKVGENEAIVLAEYAGTEIPEGFPPSGTLYFDGDDAGRPSRGNPPA